MTRERVLAILDGTDPVVGRRVAFALKGLIVLTAVSVTLETVPSLHACCAPAFLGFEMIAVAAFGIEYALRVWATPARWRYVFSLGGLVDLLSFLPSLLVLGTDWAALRTLRLVRLLRLFRLLRLTIALDRLADALREVREELIVFGMLALIVIYLAAVGIYHFEHEVQPEAFGSIPQSLWWAVVSLTTVGYGDVTPITTGGRIFTSMILFLGLGIVAVPTGLIASALAQQRRARHARERDDDR
jgi:voltage-gated potassium channel